MDLCINIDILHELSKKKSEKTLILSYHFGNFRREDSTWFGMMKQNWTCD